MPVHFTCPHCGTTTDVDEQSAGQSVSCVRCGKTVSVPGLEGQHPPKRGPGACSIILCILGLGVLVLLVCGGLLVYMHRSAKRAAAYGDCRNNLRQIGLAMHNYHDKYGCFPPAYVPDENGKPKHSWRVLLLPFMEYGTLYSQYRFDEPWNGPHNVALAALKLFEYRCPSAPTPPKPGITNYVMLVGLHAISDGPTARRKADITDGLDNTIMLIEVAGADINWMEPRDLEVDKMTFRIKHPGNEPATDLTDISSGHPRVANVLFCDGSVRSLPDGIDPKLLEAMTTIDGGEAVDLNELSR